MRDPDRWRVFRAARAGSVAAAVLLAMTAVACGGRPADVTARDQGTTVPGPPSGTSSGTTMTSPGTTVPAVTPGPANATEPAGLPSTIIGIAGRDPVSAPLGTTLVRYDRRSGVQVEVLTVDDLAALLSIEPPAPTETTIGDLPDTALELAGADLSPDGRHLAVAVRRVHGDRYLTAAVIVPLDGTASPQVLVPLNATGAVDGALRYSDDGRWLAMAGRSISIWDVDRGEAVTTDVTMPYAPVGFAWSPDGRRLAWGEHFERTMKPESAIAQVDLAASAPLVVTEHRAGAYPWWGADGQLRTTEGHQLAALDSDASREWMLGVRIDDWPQGDSSTFVWWAANEDGENATVLDLPAGFHPLAW